MRRRRDEDDDNDDDVVYLNASTHRRCTYCNATVSHANWQQHVDGRRHRESMMHAANAPPRAAPGQQRYCNNNDNAAPYAPPIMRGAPPAPLGRQSAQRPPNMSMVQTASVNRGLQLSEKRQCPRCTLVNDAADLQCVACDEDLEGEPVIYSTSTERTAIDCTACGASNPVDARFCVACGDRIKAASGAHGGGGPGAVVVSSNTHDEENVCFVCLEKPPTLSLVPCNHKTICENCAKLFVSGWQCAQCHQPAFGVSKPTAGGGQPQRAQPQPPQGPVPSTGGALGATSAPSNTANSGGRTQQQDTAAPSLQRYPPVNSTFPWIGGDINKFDGFLQEITRGAHRYAELEFGSMVATGTATIRDAVGSPGLFAKFKAAWAGAACPEGIWSGVFGWHANDSPQATYNVAREGWRPLHRRRNRHGPGEYFGLHHSQILEYTNGKHATVLLGFILRGPHLQWVEDFCYVVDNPVDESETFCLPVLTVHIAPSQMRSWTVPRTPFRWLFQWMNDEENNYIAYEGPVNALLNHRLCQVYAAPAKRNRDLRSKTSAVVVSLQREGDPKLTSYTIDVSAYTQVNNETKFSRKINVECVPAMRLPPTLWLMLVPSTAQRADDYWMVLDPFSQRELSGAHFAFNHEDSPKRGEPTLRFVFLPIHGKVMQVDVASLVAYETDVSPQGLPVIRGSGIPLAVVDA